MSRSQELFEKAVTLIPGGVNSPVRAFGSIGGTPRFIDRADGAYMYDVDGNKYLDFICSWGPMILGHNNPAIRESVAKAAEKGLSFGAATEAEVQMAELITGIVPSVEMVRMVNSGTEAVMSAVRAARGYTGRNKIVKFMGCYHGHSDSMLVQAGSGVMTAGIPDSAGVPAGCTQDTLSAIYNDADSVRALFETFPEEIAAVIEPQFPETDLETITTIVTRYYEQDTWKSNLIFEESSFDLLQDILESAGELEERAPYEDLVTTTFAAKAAQ